MADVHTRNGDIIVGIKTNKKANEDVDRDPCSSKSVRFKGSAFTPRSKFGLMVSAATWPEDGLERLTVVTDAQYEALLKRTKRGQEEGGEDDP